MKKRYYVPTFDELIDRLSIDHIKKVFSPKKDEALDKEMANLKKDIDQLLNDYKVEITSDLISKIVLLSQINLHIWELKEKMDNQPDSYDKHLKKAHQLNGLKNQIKNKLMNHTENSEKKNRTLHTNTDTDSMEAWE